MPAEGPPNVRRPSPLRVLGTLVGVVFAGVWIAAAIAIRAPAAFVAGGAAVIALAVLLVRRVGR